MNKKICVIGLGYIGLPTACLIAKSGYNVFGYDLDDAKVTKINKCICPFEETGLEKLLKDSVKKGNLVATNKIKASDIFIVCVPTPEKNHKADLSYVISAVKSIAKVLEDNNVVIIESTISPNTCKNIVAPILNKTKKSFFIAHCPERAIPGSTLYEMVHNDRIIGVSNEETFEKCKEIYGSFVKGEIFMTDLTTAECCKLMENTFRDVNIALANEFSLLAEEIDFNITEAIKLANRHPRVNILSPGPGVGGHCIPIDPWFLTEKTKNNILIKTARKINDNMPTIVVERFLKLVKENRLKIKDLKVALLGVSYKENVDDARETPAKYIYEILRKRKINVQINDPFVDNFYYPIVKDVNKILGWANAVIVVTNHDVYRDIDYPKNILIRYNSKLNKIF